MSYIQIFKVKKRNKLLLFWTYHFYHLIFYQINQNNYQTSLVPTFRHDQETWGQDDTNHIKILSCLNLIKTFSCILSLGKKRSIYLKFADNSSCSPTSFWRSSQVTQKMITKVYHLIHGQTIWDDKLNRNYQMQYLGSSSACWYISCLS
jgi:hypothetical protein